MSTYCTAWVRQRHKRWQHLGFLYRMSNIKRKLYQVILQKKRINLSLCFLRDSDYRSLSLTIWSTYSWSWGAQFILYTCRPIRERERVKCISCRLVKLQALAKVQLAVATLKHFFSPLLYRRSLWGPARALVLSWGKPRTRTKLSIHLRIIQSSGIRQPLFPDNTHTANRASLDETLMHVCNVSAPTARSLPTGTTGMQASLWTVRSTTN
jgi:hypothetical protein